MYSQRAGPLNMLGPRRVWQPAVPFDALPPVSMVLLSHNHYDHCDRRTLGMLAERFEVFEDDLVKRALSGIPRLIAARRLGQSGPAGGRHANR
jgi:L-ascorbate metabolism protein UlaG (beta-lactamase superfamily)